MRPITLEMTAFGPYSAVEVIDFRELEGRNLFLINGPTGAGKTTIFDAISFAMYGVANGTMRDTDTLRSQFASPDLMTEVTLTFVLKGIEYKVKRVPGQLKPKVRGGGFTTHSADAELYIAGDEKPIVGYKNVTQKIESVMGISAEQFRQIMMIPQGEFRKLLTSDSKEREKVLRRLFDTSLYNGFQSKLDEDAKALYKVIRSDRTLRDHELKKIQTTDERLLKLIEPDDLNVDLILETLRDISSGDREAKEALESKIKGVTKEIESLIKAKEQAEFNNKKIVTLKTLKRSLLEQEDLKETFLEKQKRLELADVAEAIEPYEKSFLQMNETHKSKEASLRGLQKSVLEKSETLKGVQKTYDHLMSEESSKKMDDYLTQGDKLKSYLDQVRDLKKLKDNVETLRTSLEKGKLEQIEGVKDLELRKQELKDLQGALSKSKDAQVDLAKTNSKKKVLDDRLLELETTINLKQRVIKGEKVLKQFKETCKNLESDRDQASKAYREGKVKYHLNQAAMLAETLEDGMPCPVCGALTHPNLARFSEGISEDALQGLEEGLAGKEKAYSKALKDFEVNEERLSDLKEDLKRKLEVLDIIEEDLIKDRSKTEKEQYEMEKALSDLNETAGAEKRLLQAKEDLEKSTTLLEEKMNNLKDLIQEISSDLKVEEHQLKAIYDDIPSEYHSYEVLNASIEKCARDRKDLIDQRNLIKSSYDTLNGDLNSLKGQVLSLEEMVKREAATLEDEKLNLQKRILEAGFEDSKAYRQAKIEGVLKGQLKEEIKSYEQGIHTLNKQIETLEEETKGLVEEETEIFDTKHDSFINQQKLLMEERNTIDKRLDTNDTIVSGVKIITERMGEKEKVYSVIGSLARVAKGSNTQNITFERYVLAAFLEDILRAANLRLNKMTQGRYILLRTEELQRKNAQSGLELEVFDNYTGKARHVKTLSGGEGFKASLAMALGLSDVVQSYSGGVQLDTMFIDEGFGTLDQESLDYAISCLIDLQEAGRLVGIISHVQELKERMDARLEVTSSQTGSETKFIIQ